MLRSDHIGTPACTGQQTIHIIGLQEFAQCDESLVVGRVLVCVTFLFVLDGCNFLQTLLEFVCKGPSQSFPCWRSFALRAL